ncbi:MAG: AAA-like domain-containing protein [Acidobacteriota bacterium]
MTIAYQSSFYVTGGTLQRDAACYVERRADDELFEGLAQGQFCYVLTSRQMGKSSLMVRTATRLRQEGAAVAVLDLTAIGQNLTAEQWYDGLIARIGQQLDIEDEIESFWLSHERLGPLQRWMFALEEIVMSRFSGRVVIFIDEIDAVRSLPFPTDEFFAGIRELYNRRSEDRRLERLVFCLLGVATPSNLIQDTRTTPFNIGRRIELNDFTEREAVVLAKGLGRDEETGRRMLSRVLYWTGGHPYLTQRVCQSVAEDESAKDASGVDRVCQSLFFSSRARERDDNLLFVRERLLRSEIDLAALLDIYSRVRRNKRVRDDETNTLISVLRLSGIAKTEGGDLRVRNRIYQRVFDREWVRANMPDAELQRQRAAYLKGLVRAAAIAAVIIVLMVMLAFTAFEQQKIAVRQKQMAEEEKQRADQNAEGLRKALERAEEEKRRADENAWRAREALASAEEEKRRADENARQARLALIRAEEERQHATESAERARLALQETEKQKRLAETERRQAEEQRAIAEKERDRAEQQEIISRQFLYATRISLAQQLLEKAKVDRVIGLLDSQRPSKNQKDVRGFEWYYLWRLCNEDLMTARTGRPVTLVHFLGNNLLTVDDLANVSQWNAASGMELMVRAKKSSAPKADFRSPAQTIQREPLAVQPSIKVTSVAISKDGKLLAEGRTDGLVSLIDVRTGEVLRDFKAHADSIETMAFSPDGKSLATGSRDHTARVWDTSDGRETMPTIRYRASVTALAFSPDGTKLATGSEDKSVRLWDMASRLEILFLIGHSDRISSIAFSPDGSRMATGSDDTNVFLWDMPAEKGAGLKPAFYELRLQPSRLTVRFKGHTGRVNSVAFSPDGNYLASASADNTIRLWKLPDKAKTESIGSPGIRMREALWFGKQEGVLLPAWFTGYDRRAEMESVGFDVKFVSPKGEEKGAKTALKGHTAGVLSVTFSPDGKRVVSGSEDGTWKLWDVETGQEWALIGEHSADIFTMAFSPDGKTLLTGSANIRSPQDKTEVKLWDVANRREIASLKTDDQIGGVVAFSLDGKTFATANSSGIVRFWDASTRKQRASLETGQTIICMAFSPDGKLLATGGSNSVKLWNAADRQELSLDQRPSESVFFVEFSPDGRVLAAATQDEVWLWDTITRQVMTKLRGHRGAVNAIAFSPDGKILATGGADYTVKLWDVGTWQERESNVLEWHSQSIFYLTFSPDSRRLATASSDGMVKLWDIITGMELATLRGHSSAVFCVIFSPDGEMMVTGGSDRTIKLWRAPRRETAR